MTLSPTSSRGGATQPMVSVVLAHSADFSNFTGSGPVSVESSDELRIALTLPPSAFANNGSIRALLYNFSGIAVTVNASLVVQSADGLIWIEQDGTGLGYPDGTSNELNLADNGGGAGVGLSWSGAVTRRVDIANAGAYSAFLMAKAVPT